MKAVFDTNILIDALNGIADAAATWASITDRVISRITWLEVLAGADPGPEEDDARDLLSQFRLVELNGDLAERVLALRRSHPRRIKLPDAIVYATAKAEACPLITRNSRDFERGDGDVETPYTLPSSPASPNPNP
ncbi:MAG: PIN domain-containing protein [Akkermansiaceae bacterium]|nr:PIN domain-containing protein [Akkermansiaceae bacterium]